MIAIIDYGMGNVRSLYNAVDYVGQESVVTDDPGLIRRAERIILPGVGAFGQAMQALRARRLDELLHEQVIEMGKPMLGICLGLQLLARISHEHGRHEGLGWLEAEVVRFELPHDFKIPHIGWNDVAFDDPNPLFQGLKDWQRSFYFVHSYYLRCDDPSVTLATCQYGIEFTAAILKDNIVATQFHPEKSQDNGIKVLENFLSWNP